MSHSAACICGGRGTVEDGPAGATYSVPCPGPPDTIQRFGRTYLITPKGEAVVVLPVATLETISAENERLQRAIDTAYGAMGSSAYVGGPTEREVWHIVADALGPLVTQHTAAAEPEGTP